MPARAWHRFAFDNIGSVNTALGSDALLRNTNGSANTACGGGALANNIGGGGNTAVGSNALSNLGTFNTALPRRPVLPFTI